MGLHGDMSAPISPTAVLQEAAGDVQILGPLGFGARGTVWSVVLPDGRKAAARVMPQRPTDDPGSWRRLQALTGVRSERVAGVMEVRRVHGGTLLLSRLVPGPTVATVRAGTAGLPRAQCWRLLVDMCDGLTALHAAGLVHGDVAPANVVLEPEGAPPARGGHSGDAPRATRAVLVDLGGLGGWEEGTGGFRAPELRTGAPAGTASDVWSAARVALWAVAEHDRSRLAEELAPALRAEPAARPTAAQLAARGRASSADTIEVPGGATLARARLREQAQRDPTRLAHGHRRRGTGRRAAPQPTGRHAARTLARVSWRPSRRLLTLTVLALLVPPAVLLSSGRPTLTMSEPFATHVEPARAVHTLTTWRDGALNRADTGALLRLSAPDSPAAHADSRLAREMAGASRTGLVTRVEVLAVGGSATRPRVRTLLSQSEYERSQASGGSRIVPAASPRCAEIELIAVKERWRVHAVADC